MKVLLYVEPHPIRGGFTTFADIAKGWTRLFSTEFGFDVRMYVNEQTRQTFGTEHANAIDKYILRSTKDEEEIFAKHALDWEESGLDTWCDLMAGTGKVTDDYLNVLEQVHARFPFEIIVHWGENGAITRLQQARTVIRVAMELGCTRAPFFNSVIMDPYGTNGASAPSRISINDMKSIVGGDGLSCHEALHGFSQSLDAPAFEQSFVPLPCEVMSHVQRAKRIAFLPLQLFDDANLLRFSPYDSIADAVQDIVPRLAEHNVTVIVKPHPASKVRKGAEAANAIARATIRDYREKVIWCDQADIPNSKLISISDFVVTVNSSVGFEALYFDKPVAVMGSAVYKPEGMFPELDDLIAGDFDRQRYFDAAGILRRFFLGGYLQDAGIQQSPTTFVSQLALIAGAVSRSRNDVAAFAEEFWHAVSPGRELLARSATVFGISTPGSNEIKLPTPSKPSAQTPKSKASFMKTLAQRALRLADVESKEQFDNWLHSEIEREGARLDFMRSIRIVDPNFYLDTYEDIRNAGVDPVTHWARHGFHEGRCPRAELKGFTPEALVASLRQVAAELLSEPMAPKSTLSVDEARNREEGLAAVKRELTVRRNGIAVVAHLYYVDLVDEILAGLRSIPEPFDLIVTMPNWGSRGIFDAVKAFDPRAIFYAVPNRGRDIGPFLDLLPILTTKKYDAVLKLQTKRGYYQAGKLREELGNLWRAESLSALLGSRSRVQDIIETFRGDMHVNMIGAAPHFLSLQKYPYHDNGLLADAALDDTTGEGFFAGTMFWVRPECLRGLFTRASLSIGSFELETGSNDGELAHLVERLFGQAAAQSGGRIVGAPSDPSASLVLSATPSPISIHTHLESLASNAGARSA